MLKRLAKVAICAALVFGWPSVAENQQGKSHAQQNQSSQTQQSVPPTHVIIDPSSAPVHVQAEPADAEKNPPEKPLPRFFEPEWVIVYITAIYVAISALMLIAIKQQARYMKRQTKILEDSVAVANASAKAANEQIEMIKQKEQARIHVIPLDFNAVDPAEPSKIMIDFVNIGPTNAFDVRVEAGVKITVEGLRPQVGEYTDLAVATLLKPDETDSSWAVCDFPPRWQNEIVEGEARITFELLGQIKYRDVFDAFHTDNFSYRMNVYGIEPLPRDFIQLKIMRKWYPFDPNPQDFDF